jgi:hypothetical protein
MRDGGVAASHRALLEPLEAHERLSADDLASRTEAEHLSAALAVQARRAQQSEVERGVCQNCGEICLPLAVYCDADCRADHEARVVAQARQRGPLG